MTERHKYLAIDLGAESGRVILGQLEEGHLKMEVVHRFPNGPVCVITGSDKVRMQWDILRLWSEVQAGIAQAVHQYGPEIASVGLDTWGVDFGLLDNRGELLANPVHYRDSRTDGIFEQAFRRVPRAEVFMRTGIQFMQLNTLYQLLCMVIDDSPVLEKAETILTTPDLFNYWFSGRKASEFTIATTTQCYNPIKKDWDRELIGRIGIPTHMFPEIVPPGTNLGPLLPYVAEEVGLGHGANLSVIAPACHDTGSAVAAVPAEKAGFAWISSGTWSVVGTEWPEPIINEQSLANNFTNEGGVGGFRFCRNVMGLWLVQECRRTWTQQGQEFSYTELADMVEQAAPFQAWIDPDDPEFFKPGDMPTRIIDFCQRTGQTAPKSKAAILRCVLESLALKYRWVIERLESMVGQRLEPIHIVGGGSQNRQLNQFTADANDKPVVTGPVEATAIGNLLMQAISLGHIPTIAAGRSMVRHSFPPAVYNPKHSHGWEEAYQKMVGILENA